MSTDKITCNDVLNHICDNLDEDMDSPTCRAIKSHIAECPDCAVYLKSMKNTIHLYKRYPLPKPSGAANRRIEDFILKNEISRRNG